MKSERRHELETNDLAKKIVQAPDYFKQYGGRVVLAVAVVVIAVLLVRNHFHSKQANFAATEEGIATARDSINQLANLNPMAAAPAEVAARRQALISNAIQGIDTVNERSEDPKYLAKAQVLRGDLYWTAANLTDLPGAATQPTLALQPKPADALMEAESAYKRVLATYPDQPLPDVTARFGLAAVAENRGQWDEARKQYESLVADPNLASAYKTQAQTRLRLLSTLQKGVYLATTTAPVAAPPAPAAASQPAAAPAASQPAR